MNKNTTILLGAIAIIAIGVGAYVSISSPSDKEFTTQSFRKSVQTQPTTTAPDGNIYGGDDDGDDLAAKPIVKYNSDKTCSVTFDDGVTMQGTSTNERLRTLCCEINKDICISGKEKGVSGVEFGDQFNSEKEIEGFTTQSLRKNSQKAQNNTQGNIYGGDNDSGDNDVMGIIVTMNHDGKCSVTFDDGITLEGKVSLRSDTNELCCGGIKHHGDICYSGKETGVSGVDFGDQLVKEKIIPEFSTQSLRKNSQKNQNNTQGNIYGGDDGDVAAKLIIKYNSDMTCAITFDDGIQRTGETRIMKDDKPCCFYNIHDVCYSGKEAGVTGVEFGDQQVKENSNYVE